MPAAPPLPILKGTLDTLVLKALTWSPMHGFEIRRWFNDHGAGALELEDSAIYQSLYRMEKDGLVTADWGHTIEGRRARYYSITSRGRIRLRVETVQWARYATLVTTVLSLAGDGGKR